MRGSGICEEAAELTGIYRFRQFRTHHDRGKRQRHCFRFRDFGGVRQNIQHIGDFPPAKQSFGHLFKILPVRIFSGD